MIGTCRICRVALIVRGLAADNAYSADANYKYRTKTEAIITETTDIEIIPERTILGRI